MKMSIIIPCKNEANIVDMIKETEKRFPNAQIITASDRYGMGKGWAIKQGLIVARGEIIAFIDGDLEIHPKMIDRLLPFLEDYDIVVGVKPIPKLLSRRLLTYFSRLYLAFLFNVKVDTQTGVKVFKRNTIPQFYSKGFLFDLEILSQAKKAGHRMIEVPIEANVNRKMKLSSIWKTFKESVTLWIELL